MRKFSSLTLSGLIAGLLLVSGFARAAENAVDRLPARCWFEAPDSHLMKVAFKWPAGVTYTANGIGVRGVISCWSGGAYDTKRDRLLIWGGGHFAYGGNEIYGFDVKALKWSIVGPPSMKVEKGYPNGSEKYSDGTPRSCHTYNYIQYVPSLDRLVSFGTVANFPASKGGKTMWAYDFEEKKWEEKGQTQAGGIGAYSALDPVTGRVYVRGTNWGTGLCWWNAKTNEWKNITGRVNHRTDYSKTAAIDPLARRFFGIGRKLIYKYEFGAGGNGTKVKQDKITTGGPQDLVESTCPGLSYDPVLDRIVGWKGGTDVWVLDLEKLEWEKVEAAAANKVTPAAPVKNGTYGRWRYIPSKNAYVVVSGVKQNVFFYRLTKREDAPIPKRFAAALKGKDPAVVAWVAGEVAKWPKAKAEPALKDGLKTQSGEAAEAIRKALASLK
ncbi:MAG: Kelch domain-containing protein [Planctomycetota bacterium]|jgi:hypothetical protein